MLRLPRASSHLRGNREGMASRPIGVGIREIIDQLLQAYSVRRRQRSLSQESPHVAVAGGIDINGECGEWIGGCRQETVLFDSGVRLGVARLALPSPGLDWSCFWIIGSGLG